MKISKSKFMAGVQCLKRLYLLVHEPQLAAQPDDAGFVEPTDCLPVPKLPEGSQWIIWEIKLDGYRAVAVKSGDAVTLYSRNRTILNKRFPISLNHCADCRTERLWMARSSRSMTTGDPTSICYRISKLHILRLEWTRREYNEMMNCQVKDALVSQLIALNKKLDLLSPDLVHGDEERAEVQQRRESLYAEIKHHRAKGHEGKPCPAARQV